MLPLSPLSFFLLPAEQRLFSTYKHTWMNYMESFAIKERLKNEVDIFFLGGASHHVFLDAFEGFNQLLLHLTVGLDIDDWWVYA